MKLVIATALLCISSILGHSIRAPGVVATVCNNQVCLEEDGCRCASPASPLPLEQTPQLVSLIFDDAITDAISQTYHFPLLSGRTNADGTPISATFFVPHEWTQYVRVNELYNMGYEIAVNSITKNPYVSYWASATVEELVEEFAGQRTIISKFANIPESDIIGARTPNLELAGNRTFRAYQQSGILYDSSWPTLSTQPLFPYSLDFLSSQACLVGTCPNEAFPGQWVVPIVDLIGPEGEQCNTLQACNIVGDRDEISAWLRREFERVYNTTKTPITLAVTSAFYIISEGGFEGLADFLDYLGTLSDVFVVSQKQLIDWTRDPVPLGVFSPVIPPRFAECPYRTCVLLKDEEIRYMSACTYCPEVFPWLGNPLGIRDSEE